MTSSAVAGSERAGISAVPFFRPAINEEDVDAVAEVLRSGWLTRGAKCQEFETAFALAVGASHAVSLNSGTAALLAALTASGIGPDHIVLIPSLAFTGTAQAVLLCGATPVLVDCDPTTFCLDAEAARSVLGEILVKRSNGHELRGAIIPINYGGAMGDVEGYRQIADEFGLKLIFDGAHCLHTAYRDTSDAPWIPIGAVDEPVCYSFYASKCITTAEGGMVTTNDAALAARLRRVSFHGITPPSETRGTGMNWDYDIEERGYKANLSDVLAALGLSQLSRGWEFHQKRRSIVSFYQSALRGNIPADIPEEPSNRQSSWHIFPLLLRLDDLNLTRDEILLQLRDRGIHCSVQWRPLHHFSLYQQLAREEKVLFGRLPVTDEIFSRMLTLPISPAHSQDEICRVVEALKSVLGVATRNGNRQNHLHEAE